MRHVTYTSSHGAGSRAPTGDTLPVGQHWCPFPRRLAAVALGAGLAVLGMCSASDTGGSGKVLEAERLVLRGKDGRVFGTWEQNPAGTGSSLALFDNKGTPRMGLYVYNDGKALVDLKDMRGGAKMRLGVLPNGSSVINLFADGHKESTLTMQVNDARRPLILLGDSQAGSQIEIYSDSLLGGGNGLIMRDRKGKMGLAVGVSPDGDKSLTMITGDGRSRFGLLLDKGEASHFMMDGVQMVRPDGR
jgi:hypothetical protein